MPVLTSGQQERKSKQRKIRNSEYYDMEGTLDRLYAESKKDKTFNHLMEIIESEENIKLAYRTIKKNTGSDTSGVDKRTIADLAKLSEEEYVRLIRKQFSNYHPRPVRRVEIPKPNGKTRPLGIPTIVDRIVQQCILQVMEPICEAKFSENSNGFRPNRSAETAIAQCMRLIQVQHLYHVVDLDIKGFFDKDEVPAAKFDIDKDAQIAHARIAIATSHVVGKGPGNSIQRDFLSQAFSDFIFAIVIEEMGLIGGIFVVFLYLCLLMRAGRIAQKCERTFPAFLVMGIALLLVSQAILNMMVAVGLFPVTGQPLPLVSKGGTSTLINCAYIGMILSVSRYTAHLEEQKAHDAQIQMQIEAGTATSEAQAAAEPTAQILNSDAKFEDEHDSSK